MLILLSHISYYQVQAQWLKYASREAYETGERTVPCMRVQCVGYNYALYDRLVEAQGGSTCMDGCEKEEARALSSFAARG
jgi:hypothetical protein